MASSRRLQDLGFWPLAGSSPQGASLSRDRVYRYALWRRWEPGAKMLAFIMLNPSTADHELDDPTIRRCIGFAKRESFGGILVLNLFALRATKPIELTRHADPVGPLNDDFLDNVFEIAREDRLTIIGAWGGDAAAPQRASAVIDLAAVNGLQLQCLGRTQAGAPRDPLYLHAGAEISPL